MNIKKIALNFITRDKSNLVCYLRRCIGGQKKAPETAKERYYLCEKKNETCKRKECSQCCNFQCLIWAHLSMRAPVWVLQVEQERENVCTSREEAVGGGEERAVEMRLRFI